MNASMLELTLFIFFISLGASLFLIPLAARLAPRFGLVDNPGGRKIHKAPVPRAGGIALLLSIAAGLAVGFHLAPIQPFFPGDQEAKLTVILVGMLAAAALGLADDLMDLKPKWKFLVQAVLAGVFALVAFRFDFFQVPGFAPVPLSILSIPFTAFWVIAVINGFNFMDGVDCLAGSVSLVVYAALGVAAFLKGDTALYPLCAAVVGALVAFVFYNRPPAMVYLGDAGASVLAFGAAAGLISLGQSSPIAFGASGPDPTPFPHQVLLDSMIVGYPFLEVTLSSIRRGIKRFYFQRSMEWSEKEHIHHRLLNMGLGPLGISAVGSGINLSLAAAALLTLTGKHALGVFCALPLAACAPFFMSRLGFFEFLNTRALGIKRPYYLMAHHFVEMQQAKLDLVSDPGEILALASQTCAEFGAQSFWIKSEADTRKDKGGLVFYWKIPKHVERVYLQHLKTDVVQGDAEVFRDRVVLENNQIEAYWIFEPTTGENELDVEYRVLMSGFMKAVIRRIHELKNAPGRQGSFVVNDLVHAKVRSSLLRRRYGFKDEKVAEKVAALK